MSFSVHILQNIPGLTIVHSDEPRLLGLVDLSTKIGWGVHDKEFSRADV